jgi:multiple antibiotic resistance protein
MAFDLGYLGRAFATLFSVVDPLAAVPIFLSMTQGDPPARRHLYARKATLTATGIMLFFLAFGETVFTLFSITVPAFRIAGGIVLLIIALDLLKATHTGVRMDRQEQEAGELKPDISVTPLGIPLLGGPGAVSSVMVLAAQQPREQSIIIVGVAILLVGASCYVALRLSETIARGLGVTGISVVSRLLGLLLLAMAVQSLIEGVGAAIPLMGLRGQG